MNRLKSPLPPTLRSLTLTTGHTPTPNRRVSGSATLRPNPSLSLRTSDTRNTLCAIRKPAFKKGDRKLITLLLSFNRKERCLREKIPTSRDYLITSVKRLRFASPKFSIIREFH